MAIHPLATAEALDQMVGLLDRVEPSRGDLAPADRLALVSAARQLAGRVDALLCTLVAEADAGNAAMRAKATPLSSWLAISGTVSKREAAGLVHRAREVAGHERVRQAALAGQVGVGQARAIAGVLKQLPVELEQAQRDQAEELLVDLAQRLDATEIARSTGQVLAAVSPSTAVDDQEQRLQRQAERAYQRRGLRFFREDGSVRFDGSLPQADAEAWMAVLDAHAESRRRAVLEERDPLATPLSPEQRRADALIAMVTAHQVGRQAPASGGDRPRVLVFLDYQQLRRDAAAAGLLTEGAELSAGELRRLCCDGGVLPVVLGGESELLDVGREHRLVTPAIRAALTARDRGCAFPTCHTRPAVCEAHHILPWWADGRTDLSNLVLLCHHHHALVEPAKHALRDQWRVRIASDGLPEFIPPRRMDADQHPIRHQRYRGSGGAPPGFASAAGNAMDIDCAKEERDEARVKERAPSRDETQVGNEVLAKEKPRVGDGAPVRGRAEVQDQAPERASSEVRDQAPDTTSPKTHNQTPDTTSPKTHNQARAKQGARAKEGTRAKEGARAKEGVRQTTAARSARPRLNHPRPIVTQGRSSKQSANDHRVQPAGTSGPVPDHPTRKASEGEPRGEAQPNAPPQNDRAPQGHPGE